MHNTGTKGEHMPFFSYVRWETQLMQLQEIPKKDFEANCDEKQNQMKNANKGLLEP